MTQDPKDTSTSETEVEEIITEEEVSSDDQTKDQQQTIEKLKESLAKSQADYDNLVKRTDRERMENLFFITQKIGLKLLPIVDNLERALEHIPEDLKDNEWVKGISSLHSSAIKSLDSLDMQPFESIGNEVDADKHDVISQAPGKENIIVNEFEKGYMLGGKVLRHAKVIVGNGNES